MSPHATSAADPVGATEIANRLNIGRPTVERWQDRYPGFPPRRWTVAGRPAWDWNHDIVPWLEATGRLKHTVWTLDTDATPGAVEAVVADLDAFAIQPGTSRGGRHGTTVSVVGADEAPPELVALAEELRGRGYVADLDS